MTALRGALIAVNEWGDGADLFLTRLEASGVAEWRVRRCGDAATAVALARDYGHIAFVTESSAASEVPPRRLRSVDLAAMPRWVVRLELVHRAVDAGSEAVSAIRSEIA